MKGKIVLIPFPFTDMKSRLKITIPDEVADASKLKKGDKFRYMLIKIA